MARINELDPETINQIAAGEVVERPSSVVKELVENAIDAKATAVTVEIRDGGVGMIRVTDNGTGIEKTDIPLVFKSHATSKISSAVDLMAVDSLGFRGEALSSIAAVAQVEMITKTPEDLTGMHLCLEDGKETLCEEIGAPSGTTLVVRNLFFHTPARRKFLKSSATEAGYVNDLLMRLSLSHPEISFRFINNRQNRIHTAGNANLKDVIYNVYGRDITANLLEVEGVSANMHLEGYIGKPLISRGNRAFENYFINGRYIKSPVITKAIEEAYKNFVMVHKYPFTALHLTIDPSTIDVNVHPSKMEIRFHNGEEVYQLVYRTVRDALEGRNLVVEVRLGREQGPEDGKRLERGEEPKKSYAEPFETNRRQKEQEQNAAGFLFEYGTVYGAGTSANKKPAPGGTNAPARNQEPSCTADAPGGNQGTPCTADACAKDPSTSYGTGAPARNQEISRGTGAPARDQEIPRTADACAKDPSTSHGAGTTAADQNTLYRTDAPAGNRETSHGADAMAEEPCTSHGAGTMAEEPCTSHGAGTSATDPNTLHETGAFWKDRDALQKNGSHAGDQMSLFDEDGLLPAAEHTNYRLIGQLFETYWLVEAGTKLFIIDQHAAHEKIMYEKLRRQYESKTPVSQFIEPPMILSLSIREEQVLLKNMSYLEGFGFSIDVFGTGTYAIRAVPADLYGYTAKDLFIDLLDSLTDQEGHQSSDLINDRLATMACKAAVKGNSRLSYAEADALIGQLMEADNPYNCPHGRPTILAVTQYELEKKFRRIQT